jgi:hypothetical protein
MASTTEVLQILNGIGVGPVDRILAGLERARVELEDLGQTELAEKLVEARQALLAADAGLFRRRVAYVTSRLGHLK